MSKDGGHPAAKKRRMSAENHETKSEGDGEDPAQSTRSNGVNKDTKQEETGLTQSSRKRLQESKDLALVNRNPFVCFLCQFSSIYKGEMKSHLESNSHMEQACLVERKLSKKHMDFLQEYILHKNKTIESKRGHIEDKTIRQISQDCTRGLGMENFVKKIEAANCLACNVFIHPRVLQYHLQLPLHEKNCRMMMEQSEKKTMSAVKNILNDSGVSQKLHLFKEGKNPFKDNHEEKSRGDCSSTPASEDQESWQVVCSLSDSKEQEDPAGGEDIGGEDDEDYACEA